MIQHTSSITRILSVDYRVSAMGSPGNANTKNPYPSALLDALAGYSYLIKTLGFTSQNITIAGDSAGGNLALALARYSDKCFGPLICHCFFAKVNSCLAA